MGGEGPEKQIDAKGVELGRRSHGGRRCWADFGRGKLKRGLGRCGGKVEDEGRKVLMEGIDERRPE